MENELNYTLDTSRPSHIKEKCKQLDERPLILNLYDNNVAYVLTGADLELRAKKPDGTIVIQDTNITFINNIVTINPMHIDITRVAGTVRLELKITKTNLSVTTFTFDLEVKEGVIQEGDPQSSNTLTVVEELNDTISEGTIILNNSNIVLDQVIDATNTLNDIIETGGAVKTADTLVNVKTFGAIGNGIANDTTAIQSAIDYASTNNKGVYFPNGKYLYNTLNANNCRYLTGDGESTKMISNYNQGIVIGADDTQISNMFFCREDVAIKQSAIIINEKYRCKIINCRFDKIGQGDTGAGVYIENIGTSQHGADDGCLVSNCYFTQCYHGVEVAPDGVYTNIVGCNFTKHCAWAIWAVAGNVTINTCSIVKCNNGIYLGNDGNGGHSTITGCNINHTFTDNGDSTYTSGYALFIDGVLLSEIISACAIYDGKIRMVSCKGIMITNCSLAVIAYEFENCQGCSIRNNVFYKSYGHTFTNTNSFVEWYNNTTFDGSHNALSEESKGHRFVGTAVGQTIADTVTGILSITGDVKIANCATYTLWKDNVYNVANNKIINQGQGGNRIKVNIQFIATIPTIVVGAADNILAYMTYGTKRVYFSLCSLENSKAFYFSLLGEIAMEYGDNMQILIQNKTGQTMTILASPSVVEFEGM